MKSYCSTTIKSLDVKARQGGNYPASNRMRFWATDFASEASFEKRRHSSQKQQVGGPAHYSSAHIDPVPKATLRRHGKNSCSMAGCLLDLFFEHGAFSDLMRIMWYHCRCKSCSEGRQIKTLCKVQRSSKTIFFCPHCSDHGLCNSKGKHLLKRLQREECENVAHVALWARFAP